jgi:4-hydroxybenzoate polyprenyltransferase
MDWALVNISKSIKNYLKLGRFFGASTTFGCILVGALTSTANVNMLDAGKLLLISIMAHSYMASLNEYWHIEEDKKNPQFQYKPLVRGDITLRNALIFILFSFIMTIILTIIFYPTLLSFIFIILAAAFGTLYTVKGKYIAWLYDFTPSIGAFFLVIYGATAKGEITSITIVAAICAFFVSVYGEWIGGMKDVDIDRKFNVQTTAVRWNYLYEKPLSFHDPNFLYFLWIVISIDIFYSMPFLFHLISPTYFYIFLLIAIPVQFYLIYKLYGKQNKESLRKHPLFFLGSMNFLAFLLVIDKITILGVMIILAFILGWVYVFSLFRITFSKD